MNNIVDIDGSYKEGGGQILRTATLFSVVFQKPCHIFNIRKNRPKPGLKLQHLQGLKALAKFCVGEIKGAEITSQEIFFYPGNKRTKKLFVNIETAGSITLVLQSLILPATLACEPVEINFQGGATDTHFAPTMNYLTEVLFFFLQKMGIKIKTKIKKRGYYPKGGAKVKVTVYPVERLKPINLLESGDLQKIKILSCASNFLKKAIVAERQADKAEEALKSLSIPMEKEIKYFNTFCAGSSIDVFALYKNTILGANALGKRGKLAEKVGEEAAEDIKKEIKIKACLDRFMADQILPYVALASGKSKFSVSKITNHALTNMRVIEKFVSGKFTYRDNVIEYRS